MNLDGVGRKTIIESYVLNDQSLMLRWIRLATVALWENIVVVLYGWRNEVISVIWLWNIAHSNEQSLFRSSTSIRIWLTFLLKNYFSIEFMIWITRNAMNFSKLCLFPYLDQILIYIEKFCWVSITCYLCEGHSMRKEINITTYKQDKQRNCNLLRCRKK